MYTLMFRILLGVLLLSANLKLANALAEALVEPLPSPLQATDSARGAEIRALVEAAEDPDALLALIDSADSADVRDRALERSIALAAADWPDDYRGRFLTTLAPAAIQIGRAHDLPPSITLAQAALESGWGRSGLTRRHNNLFGMKAISGGVRLATAEGDGIPSTARFQIFDSWAQSVEAHASLLSCSSRYAAARDQSDWRGFLEALAPVYATDPRYVDHVSALIERYGLDRWDPEPQPATRPLSKADDARAQRASAS